MTDRDRDVLHLLRRHRVLTTHQITDAFFDSPITARHRMRVMYSVRLVDRFEVDAAVGSALYHWVLDHAGWLVTSQNLQRKLHWSSKHALSIRHSQRLGHLLGVNSFFCSLLKSTRNGDGELLLWESESQLTKSLDGVVNPDGYAHVFTDRDARPSAIIAFWNKLNTLSSLKCIELVLRATKPNGVN